MKKKKTIAMSGNTAAAYIAYAFSELAIVYPITPSSEMSELTDLWSNQNKLNLFNKKLDVIEMQSESGVAGAMHGALTAGSMTTTFTASQGLLLMIPNMYKIAGEMLPCVFHISSRALACQSLSIFGDHSDVMACKNTGLAILSSSSVQEVMDFSIISHLSTLKSSIPFISFFDGFRTSHEIQNIEKIEYETILEMLEYKYIEQFRNRSMKPENPFAKPGAQNPDVYFQGRESVNKYYKLTPQIVQEYMDILYKKTNRRYHLFDYVGDKNAEKIIISMGSSCNTIEECVKYLNNIKKEKVGLIKVRLYRPFDVDMFIKTLPKTVKKIAVLDRTKEPGSVGESLFVDVSSALMLFNMNNIKVIGGRYGLSSKEFTPVMAKEIFSHLDNNCTHSFTVGIDDDVTNTSLKINNDEIKNFKEKNIFECIFWGLGSDGTVSTSKNLIKMINEHKNKMNIQGYFEYDSKKSYGVTISHLRIGLGNVNKSYLISHPDFVSCNNSIYLDKYDLISNINENGIFLLNSDLNSDNIIEKLSLKIRKILIEKNIKFYVINAFNISKEFGLNEKIGIIMQVAFLKIMNFFSKEKFYDIMKNIIIKEYEKKGNAIVEMNLKCINKAWDKVECIDIPISNSDNINLKEDIYKHNNNFIDKIFNPIKKLCGNNIKVSEMPFDGIIPTGTTKLEKFGLSVNVPKWIPENCIQCNQCVNSCPHSAIRAKQIFEEDLVNAPQSFNTILSNTKNSNNLRYKIQIYIEDCVGCEICINTCPAKNKALKISKLTEEKECGEKENYIYFDSLKNNITEGVNSNSLKYAMFKQPLFEFPGACKGCGETPYIKILTQLFGNRMMIANATGCSSIYGGTFPSIPYCKDEDGRGPAWANSLFENNAEYGLGMRLSIDSHRSQLKTNIKALIEFAQNNNIENKLDLELINVLKDYLEFWNLNNNDSIKFQNNIKNIIKSYKPNFENSKLNIKILNKMNEFQDYFVDKSIWIIGGDGWAYDIGYNGLDHCISTGKNFNILVLDTEVYSNTGGQLSKSTPFGAIAKFSDSGKRTFKKKLDCMCMSYENVYIASISLGANRIQTLKAFREAEEYNGPSIIIAYAPCIAHGINMSFSQVEQKIAVESGYWPLFRYNPNLEKPFIWDAKEEQTMDYIEFIKSENRYASLLKKTSLEDANNLFNLAKQNSIRKIKLLKQIGEFFNKNN